MADVPEMIGKYKVVSVIAKGGMGMVYKAIHPSLKREVIIKKLTIRGNPAIRERFKREAQILLDLQNPYIVHMFDYFTEGPYHYIVLEFVDGMSLDKVLKKQISLPNEIAMLIFLDACYALSYAHSKGIVHRDIKPGNILISKRAAVKLADFGIASTDKESEDDLTQSGVTLGTPSYMPPEQFADSRTVDNRADIYAMGIMLYEMVTGCKPFPGSLSPETVSLIQKGKYISPSKIDKNISPVICKLIKKMIKPNPKKRYQDVAPIIKIVKRYLKEYDTRTLREHLARIILSGEKTFTVPKIESKKHTGRKIAVITSLVLAVCAGFYALWNSGLVHKYVLRSYYTPLSVSVTLPATASAQSDLPLRAFFFENDNDTIPEVSGTRRVLVSDENQKTKSSVVYKSKPVYLKPGAYRIKVAVGPYVWWKSVSLSSKEYMAELDLRKYASRNLTVHGSAIDADTGKNISDITIISVYDKNSWIPLDSFDIDILKTGSVWKFKASAPGYKDEIFSLRIDWYQDELFISSVLHKE